MQLTAVQQGLTSLMMKTTAEGGGAMECFAAAGTGSGQGDSGGSPPAEPQQEQLQQQQQQQPLPAAMAMDPAMMTAMMTALPEPVRACLFAKIGEEAAAMVPGATPDLPIFDKATRVFTAMMPYTLAIMTKPMAREPQNVAATLELAAAMKRCAFFLGQVCEVPSRPNRRTIGVTAWPSLACPTHGAAGPGAGAVRRFLGDATPEHCYVVRWLCVVLELILTISPPRFCHHEKAHMQHR